MEKKSKKSTSKKTSKKTEINDDEILYGIECATIYFKQTNKIFLDCLNLIKKIHENPEYSDEDFDIIEERVNFPLSYSDELYDRLKHKYCNNLEDIYYSLLDGTLHEAWILGNELFKTDIVTNDKTKFNSHISKVISNGEYVEELIDFIDSVFAAYLLLDMYFRKAKGEVKIYCFGDDNIWKRYINEKLINILFYGIRRPLFDSYSTRTNTTTNQKQSAVM